MFFFDAVKSCFLKYATFRGVASFVEYWYFVLFCFITSLCCLILDTGLFDVPILTIIFFIITLCPGLAVTSRRLHGIGRSSICFLLLLIPFIGWIIFFGFMCQTSPSSMSFRDAVQCCLSKYATFHGVASRSEYWNFELFMFIMNSVCITFDVLFFNDKEILTYIIFIILIIPNISVMVRRMHDIDKSGWWILVPIYSFILTLKPTVVDFRYGEQHQKVLKVAIE